MDSSSIFNTPPLCIMASLLFGMVVLGASANPMHKPSNMPLATAESVAMSSEGLAEIDKLFNDKIDAGLIQGGVTIVARQGKVVHFSTHGKMDVDNNNQVAMKYGIRSIPTLLLFKNGEVVDQVIGNVGKDSIESMLEKAL